MLNPSEVHLGEEIEEMQQGLIVKMSLERTV